MQPFADIPRKVMTMEHHRHDDTEHGQTARDGGEEHSVVRVPVVAE